MIDNFSGFEKKKRKKKGADTSSYAPPKYVVEPAKNDTGFFMFKKAFDSMKKRYSTGYFST